ncbi:hypothetical protein [Lacipirellula sp.]|uniref:hypothetical protein n=1 Tax=Lacipirellula sp. TaxID=2691419 RepID=UPI003D0B309B
MAKEIKTRVVYDVSTAEADIKRLAKTTEAAGNQSQKAFDKMSAGASRLAGSHSGIANIALDLGKAAAAAGPIGIGLTAAAAAGAALVSSIFGLPDIMRDSTAALDAFNSAIDRSTRLRETIGDLRDAAKQSEFTQKRIDLQEDGVDIAGRRAANKSDQAEIAGKLGEWKAYYQQLGRLHSESQSRLKQGESKLAALQDQRLEREGSTLDLLRQAKKLQDSGQYDRAAGLISTAQGRENDQWDTTAAVQAQKSLETAIARSVAAERQQSAALSQRGAAAVQQIKNYEGQEAAVKRLGRELATQSAQNVNDKKSLAINKEQHEILKARGDATERAQAELRKLANFQDAERSLGEHALQGGKHVLSAATNNEQYNTARDQIGEARQELAKLQALAKTGIIDDDLLGSADRFSKLMEGIADDSDRLPYAFQQDFKGLQKAEDSVNNLLKARTEAEANTDRLKEIGATADPLAAASLSSKGLSENLAAGAASAIAIRDALANLPGAPSAGAQAQAGTAVATADAPAVVAGSTQQTFNVNVTGGMVDRSTAQQIAAMIQREARLLG